MRGYSHGETWMTWKPATIEWVQSKLAEDLRALEPPHRGEIEALSFGFPPPFEMFPRPFAAPIFLGVKQRDQRGETREAEKKAAEVAPAAKPADK